MIRGRYGPLYVAEDERKFLDECVKLMKGRYEDAGPLYARVIDEARGDLESYTASRNKEGPYINPEWAQNHVPFSYEPCPARWSADRQLPHFIKKISAKLRPESESDTSYSSYRFRVHPDDWPLCAGMDLRGENIHNVDFTPLRSLREGIFQNAQFYGCNFSNMNLVRMDARGAVFRQCDFSGSRIRRTNFNGSAFGDCKFTEATIEKANFRYTDFQASEDSLDYLVGMTLDNCSFQGASFSRANFDRCHFKNELIDFSGANMGLASFSNCTVGAEDVRIAVSGLVLRNPVNLDFFGDLPYHIKGSGTLSIRKTNDTHPCDATDVEEWRIHLYETLIREHEYAVNCVLSEEEDNMVIQSMRGLYNV